MTVLFQFIFMLMTVPMVYVHGFQFASFGLGITSAFLLVVIVEA